MKKPLVGLSDLTFIAAFLLALANGPQMLSLDSDLGRHITLGNYILDNRIIPTHDLFSHTLSGESRPPYEWLSQVAFAVANRLLGLDGVILLTAIVLATTFALLYRYSYRRSQSPLIALFITFAVAATSSIHWLPRPHIVTFLLLAVWIHNLEQFQTDKPPRLSVFPLIMLLWANLHGGFVFGFLALAAYCAGWLWDRLRKQATNETGKKYLLIGLASLIASVLTPDLWRNWEAVLNNRSAFILSRTVETMPPNLSDPSNAPFVILLALSAIFFLTNRRAVSASHVILLGGFGVLALMMTRNIPLFAIACAPILTEWISAKTNQLPVLKRFDERFVNLAAARQPSLLPIVAIILAIGFFAYNHAQGRQAYHFNPQAFPVRAVDWLEENPFEGNMFNEFNWGGYLLYRTWPRDLVFVDSQSDFYGEPLMRDYETIMLAQNDWKRLLDTYQVNWVIIPINTPLAVQLKQETGWMPLYQDPTAIIFRRR